MPATWSDPRTYTNGELLTKSIMDQHWRDNLLFLKTPAAAAATPFATTFTTTSATFVDVTGVTVTFTNYGGGFDVVVAQWISNSGTADSAFDIMVDGVSVSGTTHGVYRVGSPSAAASVGVAFVYHVSAKAAGSHTVKLQARTTGTTLSIYGTTANFSPTFYVIERGA